MTARATLLVAALLLPLVALSPGAAASPPTCDGSHALVAYVDCAAAKARGVAEDARQCAEEQIYIWSDSSGVYVRWDCPFWA